MRLTCPSIASLPHDETTFNSSSCFLLPSFSSMCLLKTEFCPEPRTYSAVHIFFLLYFLPFLQCTARQSNSFQYTLDTSFGKQILFLCSCHSNLVCTLCIYFGSSCLHGKDLILLAFSLLIFFITQKPQFSNQHLLALSCTFSLIFHWVLPQKHNLLFYTNYTACQFFSFLFLLFAKNFPL